MRRKKILWGVLAAVIVLVLVLIFVIMNSLERQLAADDAETGRDVSVTDDAWEPEEESEDQVIKLNGQEYSSTDEIESYLILGIDDNEFTEQETGRHHGGMADTLMVLVINHTERTWAMLEINRDTSVVINLIDNNGEGRATAEAHICLAHVYGGNEEMNSENTVRAVRRLLGGVAIDGWYSLTLEALPELNNAVDGVPVTIEDDFSKEDPSLVMGETITLSDEQVEHFVRGRMSVGDGENQSRLRRQRQFMTALVSRIHEKTEEDAGFPVKLFNKLNPYTTSTITGKQISTLAKELQGYTGKGIYTIEGTVGLRRREWNTEAHREFYPDAESQLEVETELFHLTPIQ